MKLAESSQVTRPIFTWLKSTMETLEQCVKSIENQSSEVYLEPIKSLAFVC